MSATARLVCATLVGCVGLLVVWSGATVARPSLAAQLRHLQRPAHPRDPATTMQRWRALMPTLRRVPIDSSMRADLRLLGRPAETHAAYLLIAGVVGLMAPPTVHLVGRLSGLFSLSLAVALVIALVAAAVAPLLVQSTTRAAAAELRNDVRYQLSAYLDVVTMLLAGNVGNEGSLRQAALTGDGRLFVELRRRIMIAETSNRSLVSALASLGDDLALVELQQIAASAALGSSAGAPMARSLQAKCASLRSALASDQEADARVRTGKITIPLVAMSLLIMAAVLYPALNFSG